MVGEALQQMLLIRLAMTSATWQLSCETKEWQYDPRYEAVDKLKQALQSLH